MSGQEEKGATEKERNELLEWFVTDAPLYHIVRIRWPFFQPETAKQILPEMVTMRCDRCKVEPTNWKGAGSQYHQAGPVDRAVYRCQNCGESTIVIYFRWLKIGPEVSLEKMGRAPRPEISPPKELAKALGRHQDFYRKGMTLRHHGFGLGALVYFRRIVEDTTGELLDLLEMAIRETGEDERALAIIAEARAALRFEDKVRVAAKALPSHLLLGGANPLQVLYQLVSDGIHARTDEESIEIVDGIDRVLAYLFTELKAHAEKRKGYADALRELEGRRSAAKKEAGEVRREGSEREDTGKAGGRG